MEFNLRLPSFNVNLADPSSTNSSLASTGGSELPAESEFIMAPTMSDSGSLVLPEKYLTNSKLTY